MIFILMLAYIPFSLLTCQKHNEKVIEVKEVPEFVSVQIRKELTGKKKRLPYTIANGKPQQKNKHKKKKKKKKRKNGKK